MSRSHQYYLDLPLSGSSSLDSSYRHGSLFSSRFPVTVKYRLFPKYKGSTAVRLGMRVVAVLPEYEGLERCSRMHQHTQLAHNLVALDDGK